MVTAELIQASNNTKLNTPIYTFKLTYPKKSWWRRLFGMTATRYVTHTHPSNILCDAAEDAREEDYQELSRQMYERVDFSQYVFRVVNNNLKMGKKEIDRAVKLFGDNVQNVLKQYKPGEVHNPFGVGFFHYEEVKHRAVALAEFHESTGDLSGWNFLGAAVNQGRTEL